MNRLRFYPLGTAEDLDPLRVRDREKIVWARNADRARKRRNIVTRFAQIARIACEHHCDVSAGRMSGDEQPLRIAAQLRQLAAQKRERLRAILDELRKPVLWKESVIGNRDD